MSVRLQAPTVAFLDEAGTKPPQSEALKENESMQTNNSGKHSSSLTFKNEEERFENFGLLNLVVEDIQIDRDVRTAKRGQSSLRRADDASSTRAQIKRQPSKFSKQTTGLHPHKLIPGRSKSRIFPISDRRGGPSGRRDVGRRSGEKNGGKHEGESGADNEVYFDSSDDEGATSRALDRGASERTWPEGDQGRSARSTFSTMNLRSPVNSGADYGLKFPLNIKPSLPRSVAMGSYNLSRKLASTFSSARTYATAGQRANADDGSGASAADSNSESENDSGSETFQNSNDEILSPQSPSVTSTATSTIAAGPARSSDEEGVSSGDDQYKRKSTMQKDPTSPRTGSAPTSVKSSSKTSSYWRKQMTGFSARFPANALSVKRGRQHRLGGLGEFLRGYLQPIDWPEFGVNSVSLLGRLVYLPWWNLQRARPQYQNLISPGKLFFPLSLVQWGLCLLSLAGALAHLLCEHRSRPSPGAPAVERTTTSSRSQRSQSVPISRSKAELLGHGLRLSLAPLIALFQTLSIWKIFGHKDLSRIESMRGITGLVLAVVAAVLSVILFLRGDRTTHVKKALKKPRETPPVLRGGPPLNSDSQTGSSTRQTMCQWVCRHATQLFVNVQCAFSFALCVCAISVWSIASQFQSMQGAPDFEPYLRVVAGRQLSTTFASLIAYTLVVTAAFFSHKKGVYCLALAAGLHALDWALQSRRTPNFSAHPEVRWVDPVGHARPVQYTSFAIAALCFLAAFLSLTSALCAVFAPNCRWPEDYNLDESGSTPRDGGHAKESWEDKSVRRVSIDFGDSTPKDVGEFDVFWGLGKGVKKGKTNAFFRTATNISNANTNLTTLTIDRNDQLRSALAKDIGGSKETFFGGKKPQEMDTKNKYEAQKFATILSMPSTEIVSDLEESEIEATPVPSRRQRALSP